MPIVRGAGRTFSCFDQPSVGRISNNGDWAGVLLRPQMYLVVGFYEVYRRGDGTVSVDCT